MPRVIGSLLLCLGLGLALCRLDTQASAPPAEPPSPTWVRTAHGWESRDSWHRQPRPRPPLSPFVVAGVQVLGSLLALAAFAPAGERRNHNANSN